MINPSPSELIVADRDLRAIGATALWGRHKTAFVCSQRCPGPALLRAIDWVTALQPAETVLFGGWHTPVEREVLRLALRRKIPLIVAETRSPRQVLPVTWRAALHAGTMLILHPLPHAKARITAEKAAARIAWVLRHAETITVAHASSGGALVRILGQTGRSACFL